MRKGNQIKLIGRYPYCGTDGFINYSWETIYRHTTAEEVQAWRDCPESRGLDCAGESRLPPTCASVDYEGGTIHRSDSKITKDEEIKLSDDTFTVVRARCAPHLAYRKMTGMTLVMNNRTGEEGYIRRDYTKLAQFEDSFEEEYV